MKRRYNLFFKFFCLLACLVLGITLTACNKNSTESESSSDMEVIYEYIDETESSSTESVENEPNTDSSVTEPTVSEESKTEEVSSTESLPSSEPKPATPEEIDYSNYITVASYNIKCLLYGKQLNEIADEIKKVDPDIIGLQEVDNGTNRSSNVEQIKQLALKSGYEYYYFSKSIDFDGGAYGHAIMSKYPITNFETVYFSFQYSEKRCYSRSEINVNGNTLVVYNTHLCLGKGTEQARQLSEISARAQNEKNSVILGDMNTTPNLLRYGFDAEKMIALNGGETYQKPQNTYPQGYASNTPIDNIIVSRSLKYYWESENDTGIIVNRTDNSDHNMIYTYLNFQ